MHYTVLINDQSVSMSYLLIKLHVIKLVGAVNLLPALFDGAPW